MRATGRLRLLVAGVASLLAMLSLASASASSANISKSYRAAGTVPVGSIVSLDPSKAGYVQLANVDNGAKVIGVAVGSDDSLLAVDANSGNVQVATSGTASVLVSTLSGAIKIGDQVAVSPFNGIGMKSQLGSYYVGLAQTSFDDKSDGRSAQKVTDKSGNGRTIHVGYVRVSISPGVNNTGQGTQQLSMLQRLGKSLTGHSISNLRIILSLLVAVVALLILVTLIYASIYGSIISVGRNPLAKHAIFRTLGSVAGMVVLTAGVAAALIFFLLH